jgi:hypothetical protein
MKGPLPRDRDKRLELHLDRVQQTPHPTQQSATQPADLAELPYSRLFKIQSARRLCPLCAWSHRRTGRGRGACQDALQTRAGTPVRDSDRPGTGMTNALAGQLTHPILSLRRAATLSMSPGRQLGTSLHPVDPTSTCAYRRRAHSTPWVAQTGLKRFGHQHGRLGH